MAPALPKTMRKSLYVTLILSALGLGAAGCPDRNGDPMEEAGEKVEETTEDIQGTLEESDPAERVDEEMEEMTEGAKDAINEPRE